MIIQPYDNSGTFLGRIKNTFRQMFPKKRQKRLMKFAAEFETSMVTIYNINRQALLPELCDKYGSDKGELTSEGHPYTWQSHAYTDFYSRMFDHCRTKISRVFEVGLGTNNPDLVSSMGIPIITVNVLPTRDRGGSFLSVALPVFCDAIGYF